MTAPSVATLGLVDCNAFYCGCEVVFRPHLAGRPLVVLSNNDGCAVARSAEAKALGIKMGEPWHQIRARLGEDTVTALSSNYALYADMSNRVMAILAEMAPSIEVSSIDEAFVGCRGISTCSFGHAIRDRVRQWTGLPVCVGFGATKVRAKLANHVAKNLPEHSGVFDVESLSSEDQTALLSRIPVSDVWGVGRRLSQRLADLGISTARDLRDANPHRIREQFSVALQRTVDELRGIPCLPLELAARAQQQIMCSRSFGREIMSAVELREAVLTYVSRAAEKLRRQDLIASGLVVFAQTNPFAPQRPQYSRALTIPLPTATDDTRSLAHYASAAIARIYRPGFGFKKAGVILTELRPRSARQGSLFASGPEQEKRARLNFTIDRVNARYGRDTISLAGTGIDRRWAMRRQNLSPAYTTRWEDLPVVNAGRISQPEHEARHVR